MNKHDSISDDVTIYVKPLECSLASTLGYSGDTDFNAICVNLATDGKPTFIVN